MRRQENSSNPNDIDRVKGLFQADENHEQTQFGPNTQSQNSHEVEREPLRWGRNIFIGGLAVSLVVGGAGAAAAWNYFSGVNGAFELLKAKSEGKLADSGEAEVTKVVTSMDLLPITVAEVTTETKGTKTGIYDSIEGGIGDWEFDIGTGEATVTVDSTVTQKYQIAPNEVTFEYNPKEKKVTVTALDTAITTEMSIEGDVVDETLTGMGLAKKIGGDLATGLKSTIDSAEIPLNVDIARGISEGSINLDEGLRDITEFFIIDQVFRECTDNIVNIPNFEDQVKANVLTAVQGRIFDPNESNDILFQMLNDPNITDLPAEEQDEKIKGLIKNADVEIKIADNIAGDEEQLKAFEDYKELKVFETTFDDAEPIACGVDDLVTLAPPVEDEVQNG